jgi:hypothetical protein
MMASELLNIPSISFVVDRQRSLRLRKPTVFFSYEIENRQFFFMKKKTNSSWTKRVASIVIASIPNETRGLHRSQHILNFS